MRWCIALCAQTDHLSSYYPSFGLDTCETWTVTCTCFWWSIFRWRLTSQAPQEYWERRMRRRKWGGYWYATFPPLRSQCRILPLWKTEANRSEKSMLDCHQCGNGWFVEFLSQQIILRFLISIYQLMLTPSTHTTTFTGAFTRWMGGQYCFADVPECMLSFFGSVVTSWKVLIFFRNICSHSSVLLPLLLSLNISRSLSIANRWILALMRNWIPAAHQRWLGLLSPRLLPSSDQHYLLVDISTSKRNRFTTTTKVVICLFLYFSYKYTLQLEPGTSSFYLVATQYYFKDPSAGLN